MSQTCKLQIVEPQEGASLGSKTTVEGTATIPDNAHVWVLVAVRGIRGWWPQGGGSAELTGNEWAVLAFIGQRRDIGTEFQVAAAVVGDAANRDLEKWVAQGNRTGHYPPIKFPDPLEGCPIVKVRVKKVSH